MKIKYVFKQTVVGWNWHPVIDDQVLFYPHGTLSGVRQFVDAHIADIQDYLNSDDNLGLGFYVCGYDGDATGGTANGVRDGRRLDKWIVTIPPQSV